jgi:methionine-rich copper-binding protein CopC
LPAFRYRSAPARHDPALITKELAVHSPIFLRAGVAVAALALATPAIAHTRLLSSTPAAKSVASNVTSASLVFSERVLPKVSGVDLAMTGMAGMAAHAPMKVSGIKTSLSPDGRTLVAAFPKQLAPGTYRLDWHAVSADTHRIKGTLSFTVR